MFKPVDVSSRANNKRAMFYGNRKLRLVNATLLMWPRCRSLFAMLTGNDPVAAWFDRIADLSGGLGRAARRR